MGEFINFYWPYFLPREGGTGKGMGEGWGRIKHGAYVLSCMMHEYFGDRKKVNNNLFSHLFIQSDSHALKVYNIKVRQDNSL